MLLSNAALPILSLAALASAAPAPVQERTYVSSTPAIKHACRKELIGGRCGSTASLTSASRSSSATSLTSPPSLLLSRPSPDSTAAMASGTYRDAPLPQWLILIPTSNLLLRSRFGWDKSAALTYSCKAQNKLCLVKSRLIAACDNSCADQLKQCIGSGDAKPPSGP
jgi:hypothetical protein